MIKLLKKYYQYLPVLLYLPSLFVFFSGDDWFHLRITQISSVKEFLNFFAFTHNSQSAAFYRPLPTQVFFFVFQRFFGLTVWPHHLFVLICFSYSLYLLYRFAVRELKSPNLAQLSVFIYALSVSNFTRLYFLSAFQEVSLVIFALLCLLNFPKSGLKTLLFFILALLSKETAVVIPLLLLLFNQKYLKQHLFSLLPVGLILSAYLYFRLVVFGSAVGDSYLWNFSLLKAANTLMWYLLWSFGAPELLVDYVGSGLKLVPKFFVDYPFWWGTIISLLLGTISTTAILFLQKLKKIDVSFLKYILFFFITILPVLFLPSHKFALELGLPLVGFSLALVWLLPKKLNRLAIIFLCLFAGLNISMNYLSYTRHYSVSRGRLSQKIYIYLSEAYPVYPIGKYYNFVNDSQDFGLAWGQSKQISQTLSGSDFFRVYYHNPNLKVYYEDIPEATPAGQSPINLSTRQFIAP